MKEYTKIDDKVEYFMPTRICSICHLWEYPGAKTAYSFSWICPECAERIKKVIYPKEEYNNE